MNILDENIIASQRQLLRSWRIRVRQIGYDMAQKGISDDQIIPFLLQRRRPTFFTRDLGFFERHLCHRRYCLVGLAIEKQEVATFIRRVLNHGGLDTQAKRMGTVIRVSHQGLRIWRQMQMKSNHLTGSRFISGNGLVETPPFGLVSEDGQDGRRVNDHQLGNPCSS